jgi:hypothetical protein
MIKRMEMKMEMMKGTMTGTMTRDHTFALEQNQARYAASDILGIDQD